MREARRPRGFADEEEYEAWAAQEVSITEATMWVAAHLNDVVVEPRDAPGPIAWGMYQSYSASQERKNEFWDKKCPKARMEAGDEDVGVVDGQHVIEAAERIRGMLRTMNAT